MSSSAARKWPPASRRAWPPSPLRGRSASWKQSGASAEGQLRAVSRGRQAARSADPMTASTSCSARLQPAQQRARSPPARSGNQKPALGRSTFARSGATDALWTRTEQHARTAPIKHSNSKRNCNCNDCNFDRLKRKSRPTTQTRAQRPSAPSGHLGTGTQALASQDGRTQPTAVRRLRQAACKLERRLYGRRAASRAKWRPGSHHLRQRPAHGRETARTLPPLPRLQGLRGLPPKSDQQGREERLTGRFRNLLDARRGRGGQARPTGRPLRPRLASADPA